MTSDTNHLRTLANVRSEIEATIIVNALGEHGIHAAAVGGHTANFKAEAPGDVAILINEDDVERAQSVLDQIREDKSGIDWSQVDVGEPEA